MSEKKRTTYPYARPSAMEAFFGLIVEEKGWKPGSITTKTLTSLGIAPSKENETLACLKFLGIIDERGVPTDMFSALRKDFQPELAKAIRTKYEEVLDQIPARRISQETLVAFFKSSGFVQDTAEYQGALFVFLCQKAGIALPNASTSFKRARLTEPK